MLANYSANLKLEVPYKNSNSTTLNFFLFKNVSKINFVIKLV